MAKTLHRSFSGGEITPEMYGRLDLAKYQTGLATCRNFRVLPHGPAQRRTGFGFVNEALGSEKAANVTLDGEPFDSLADVPEKLDDIVALNDLVVADLTFERGQRSPEPALHVGQDCERVLDALGRR